MADARVIRTSRRQFPLEIRRLNDQGCRQYNPNRSKEFVAGAAIRKLKLTQLERGLPGLTPEMGAACSQAAAVCFENQKHAVGVEMALTGVGSEIFTVEWKDLNAQARRTWWDLSEAVEMGACAVAFLLVLAVTEYTVIRRSVKGTGIDYWLGTKGDPTFEAAARLEVSGILSGEEGMLAHRVESKRRQSRRSDATMIPGYVVVVKFSVPTARMVKT